MAITNAQQAKQILMEDGGPVVQAGVKNYKPSKMVTVPKVAKSSPTHPTAKLAYITDAEKKLLIKKNLHGSLKGKPNRGPGGIPSLQGDFGPGGKDPGGFRGGADIQSAETELNSESMDRVIKVLEKYKSKFILYTYDSFTFDFDMSEGKELILKIKNAMKYPTRVSFGGNYGDLKDVSSKFS